jgi:hypothetical protein
MYKTLRIVHCPECGQIERMIAVNILTASCPNCKPLMAFLEWLGMTPNEALFVTALTAGVAYLSKEDR